MRLPTEFDNPMVFFERAKNERFVYFDTETTDVGPDAEIITIGFVTDTGEWEYTPKPTRAKVSTEAAAVHGLNQRHVDRHHKEPISQSLKSIHNELGEGPYTFVAWNAPFDVRLVIQSLEAEGLSVEESPFAESETLCAMTAVSELCDFPTPPGSERERMSMSLDTVCLMTNVSTAERDDAHGALVDTRLIPKVVQKVQARSDFYKGIGRDPEKIMRLLLKRPQSGIESFAALIRSHENELGCERVDEGLILRPRYGELTDGFWDFWRNHKPTARLIGFQPGKDESGKWMFGIRDAMLKSIMKDHQNVAMSR